MIKLSLQFFGGRGSAGGNNTGGAIPTNTMEETFGKRRGFLNDQQVQDAADVFDGTYGELPNGSVINLSYQSPGEGMVNVTITKKSEDNFTVNANGERFKMDRDEVNESFIGGLFEDGVRVKAFDVVYKSKSAAVNAAMNEHPAVARGEEVYAMQNGNKYIVTTTPRKYKGWKRIKVE